MYDKERSWPASKVNSITVKHRGNYFNGVDQYVDILSMGASNMPLLGCSGSVLAWVKIEDCTRNTIFAQNYASTGTNYLLFLTRDCKTYAYLQNDNNDFFGEVMTQNEWHLLMLTFEYPSSTGKTVITLYRDLAEDSAITRTMNYTVNIKGDASIGMEYDDGSKKTDFFKGYIWQVILYNYAISYETHQAQFLGSGKPASATFTLSTCALNQYIDEGGNCFYCLSSCATTGCVKGNSCNYCADYKCAVCTTFDIGSCTTCINNLAVVNGNCTCYDGYYLHFSLSSCLSCEKTCVTCKGGSSSECMSCKSGAALSEGPSGECICFSTHFASPDAANCQPCDFACATCKGWGPNQCLSCVEEATLIGSPAGTCVCLPSAMQQLQPRCVKKYANLQLTSDEYVSVFISIAQSLSFLSEGKELYAVPNLQAYSLLFWLQIQSPLPISASILTLTTRGKDALTIRIENGQIVGKSCNACGECISLSTEGLNEAYKWVHIGVAVDGTSQSLTLTVTPWKQELLSVSGENYGLPLLEYDSSTSNLSIGGFLVSYI